MIVWCFIYEHPAECNAVENFCFGVPSVLSSRYYFCSSTILYIHHKFCLYYFYSCLLINYSYNVSLFQNDITKIGKSVALEWSSFLAEMLFLAGLSFLVTILNVLLSHFYK